MKIILQTKNLTLNRSLRQYTREKIDSLEKFFKNYPGGEIWVELSKTTLHHRKGKVFQAEGHLKLPGKNLRATAQSEDLRLAINELRNDLEEQLGQYKNKLSAKEKRGQRLLKRSLYLSPQARFFRKGRIKEEGI